MVTFFTGTEWYLSGLSQVVLYIKQFVMSNKMAWSNYYYSDLGQRDLSMIWMYLAIKCPYFSCILTLLWVSEYRYPNNRTSKKTNRCMPGIQMPNYLNMGKMLSYPPASEASGEVTNLTERKNQHTPVYGVKEFVCLSACLWSNFNPIISGLAEQNRLKFTST